MLPLSYRLQAVFLINRILRGRLSNKVVAHQLRALLQLAWYVFSLRQVVKGATAPVKHIFSTKSWHLVSRVIVNSLIGRQWVNSGQYLRRFRPDAVSRPQTLDDCSVIDRLLGTRLALGDLVEY